jgi:hypothetical protein
MEYGLQEDILACLGVAGKGLYPFAFTGMETVHGAIHVELELK